MPSWLPEKDCLSVALESGYHGYIGGPVAEFMHPEVGQAAAPRILGSVCVRWRPLRCDLRRAAKSREGLTLHTKSVGQRVSQRRVMLF